MSNLNEVIEAPKKIEAMSSENIKNYWTKERKLNAKPINIPSVTKNDIEEIIKNSEELNHKTVLQDKVLPELLVNTATDILSLTNNSDYHTENVRDIVTYPYRAVGKLFMSFPTGDYVATAWTIGESMIFTAGHCVYDKENGGWATNILFSTNYADGNPNEEDFVAKTFYSLNGWINNRDFKYDLAVCIMQKPVRPTTGSLGWVAYLQPDNRIYESIGYPADDSVIKEFDGKFMWKCVGKNYSYARHNKFEIIGMHNNMTGGCSGGPWLTSYNNQIYVNGINSFNYQGEEGKMYSPYFGEGFLNLINVVKDI